MTSLEGNLQQVMVNPWILKPNWVFYKYKICSMTMLCKFYSVVIYSQGSTPLSHLYIKDPFFKELDMQPLLLIKASKDAGYVIALYCNSHF